MFFFLKQVNEAGEEKRGSFSRSWYGERERERERREEKWGKSRTRFKRKVTAKQINGSWREGLKLANPSPCSAHCRRPLFSLPVPFVSRFANGRGGPSSSSSSSSFSGVLDGNEVAYLSEKGRCCVALSELSLSCGMCACKGPHVVCT